MVAESWKRLITKKHTPTTTSLLSLTVHQITVSKEATTLLHHYGVGISYNDVQLIPNCWTTCIALNRTGMVPARFLSNERIQATFDNSDGRQQTIAGGQTTGTTFQVKSDNNNNNNNNNNNRNNSSNLF